MHEVAFLSSTKQHWVRSIMGNAEKLKIIKKASDPLKPYKSSPVLQSAFVDNIILPFIQEIFCLSQPLFNKQPHPSDQNYKFYK